MSLRSAVQESKAIKHKCAVRLVREKLTPAQVVEYDAEIADRSTPGAVLSRALLTEWKIELPGPTIMRHRKRECGCDA